MSETHLTPEEKEKKKKRKKIPRSIMLIGTFQVATGLIAIMLMLLTGNGNWILSVLATGYIILGAGLLAIMEWARFLGVMVHAMALVYVILGTVIFGGQSGWVPAVQTIIAGGILYILTRPEIRAKYQRRPYPPPSKA